MRSNPGSRYFLVNKEGILAARENLHQFYGEHPYQVMVINEQDAFQRKIRDILHGIGGFQVIAETASYKMAWEMVAQVQIDLVIVEFTLQEEGCVELIARLKHLSKPPAIIVFSTTMHEAFLTQIILAGADGYLMKDTPTRDIIRAFKNFERGGPAMQPSVTAHVIQLLAEQCRRGDAHRTNNALANGLAAEAIPVESAFDTGMRLAPVSEAEPTNDHSYTFLAQLSPQEERVFALLRQGQRNKQIAAHLAISPYTVSKHVQNILRKLGVVNRTQAAAYPLK